MNELDHSTVKILYVDDEELARKYFVRVVESEYEVLTASSVNDALDILESPGGQVDVIVTDYRMPEKVGSELLRQVERQYPHIVRILVTAYADKEVLLDTINSGETFRILEKPLDLEEVRSTLHLASKLARERIGRRQKWMAIDETLAFLAHELNTPLATIANFAKGIQQRVNENTLPQQQREVGEAAIAMGDNARYCMAILATFVDSVRHASFASAGYTGKPIIAASQLIASLLDAYPLTSSQRILIRRDIREDFPIKALPNCVALVLSSLLSNALRALEGQPQARIGFTVLIDGNPQIRVSDNGPGIAPGVLERLLIDPITTHADAGASGRGMIFCKRIMQSFGGDILIHSEQGRSTTITLNFPEIKK